MTVHVHALDGCTPEALAHYLKALGVLRVVAEQRDPHARGFWRNEAFVLVTSLDRGDLLDFFASSYEPTPLLAPWNSGSGFYPKDNKEGIDPIRRSTSRRFAPYRQAIARAEDLLAGRTAAPRDEDKSALLSGYARTQTDLAYAWLSAAVAINRDGDGRYPALLGTGGNDGRLDFTNNFMQRLVELVDVDTGAARASGIGLLDLALFGGARAGLVDRAIGQFLPGAAGGANSTAGLGAVGRMNPWDLVLMLEGAVVLRVASLRRLDGAELAQAAAPFALRNTTEGYGTASAGDSSARGEQWMPLWSNAASLTEVKHLFGEAKLASGRASAQNALEAARAVARIGSARGLTSFRRFSFIERNGQSNLAVPLGSIAVHESAYVRLLDQLDGWLDAFRGALRSGHAPSSFAADLRSVEGAAFACTSRHADPRAWQRLVMALGEAEQGMVRRPKATYEARLRPLPRLSAAWLNAVQDDGPETRVAIAIASATGPVGRDFEALGPIRIHCAPLSRSQLTFETTSEGLAKDPDVVWIGRNVVDDLAACVLRRAITGRRAGCRSFPLDGSEFALLTDVAAFIEGRLDDGAIGSLARGLMSVQFEPPDPGLGTTDRAPGSLSLYAAFRTVYSPVERRAGVTAPEPTALRQLLSSRTDEAFRTIWSRLVALGLRPKLDIVVAGSSAARRTAAALAIPIAHRDYTALHKLIARSAAHSKETSA
jgi:CRISPR-associated protein Csx17